MRTSRHNGSDGVTIVSEQIHVRKADESSSIISNIKKYKVNEELRKIYFGLKFFH